ncbi:hypothetical protein [Paenibacillus sp. FSL R10-2788]
MAENPRITAPESVRIKAGEFAVNHCGSLWIAVDRCGSLWIAVDRCGSL